MGCSSQNKYSSTSDVCRTALHAGAYQVCASIECMLPVSRYSVGLFDGIGCVSGLANENYFGEESLHYLFLESILCHRI